MSPNSSEWYHKQPRPFIWGHRGVPSECLENTIPSLRMAAQHRLDGVEFDVQCSGDGVPFVFHDDNLRRLTGRNYSLDNCLWADVAAVRLKDAARPEWAEGSIPTLDEVLATLPRSLRINVEIKTNRGQSDEDLLRIIALLDHYQRLSQTLISSFDHSVLSRIFAIAPKVALATLWDEDVTLRDLAEENPITRIVHIAWKSCTEGIVAGLHQLGYRVGVWGLTQSSDVQYCRDMLCEAVFIDNPQWVQDIER